MRREGAELAFTYQNEKLKSRVADAAALLSVNVGVPREVAWEGKTVRTSICAVSPKFRIWVTMSAG